MPSDPFVKPAEVRICWALAGSNGVEVSELSDQALNVGRTTPVWLAGAW